MNRTTSLLCGLLTLLFGLQDVNNALARQGRKSRSYYKRLVYRITLHDGSVLFGLRYRKKNTHVELIDNNKIILIPLKYIEKVQSGRMRPGDTYARLLHLPFNTPNPKSKIQRTLFYKNYKKTQLSFAVGLILTFYAGAVIGGILNFNNEFSFYVFPIIGPMVSAGFIRGSLQSLAIFSGLVVSSGQLLGVTLLIMALISRPEPYIPPRTNPKLPSKHARHIPKALFPLMSPQGPTLALPPPPLTAQSQIVPSNTTR